MNAESSVKERYASAAQQKEQALCCPVQYDPKYLKIIPEEVLEKDYGCGDPSAYLEEGETVLDLGSGVGKICFIAAQVVGPSGKVIGVDMTDEMLEVARRNAPVVANRLGYGNVQFRKGRIQDLALDLEKLEEALQQKPIQGSSSFLHALQLADQIRRESPLIPAESIDAVVSNCVLNLVDPSAKSQLFREIFRVLKVGGRAVISDIVADREPPLHLQNDPTLYSGCISGAFVEADFLQAFEDAGFYGIELAKHEDEPWQTVEGINFRSVTVLAYKGAAVSTTAEAASGISAIYRGPFKEIADDDGNHFWRGEPEPVSILTLEKLQREPYASQFAFVETSSISAVEESFPDVTAHSPLPGIPLRRLPSIKPSGGKCC
ncbi:MAG: methyltransferase domain-containing protein [Verrucomicrobiales bacterium]